MKYYFVSNDERSEIIQSEEPPPLTYSGGPWTSCSCGHDTKLELMVKERISPKPCNKCGQLFHTHYVKHVAEKLRALNLCHTCNFWTEYVEKKDHPEAARIAGCHWWAHPEVAETGNPQFRGMGGRRFKIKWKDGREQVTNNLWYQGTIPERFRDELPDNAEFVEEPDPVDHGRGFLS